jgi:hypothetical protein
VEARQVDRAQRGLRDVRVGQGGLEALLLVGVEDGRREDEARERLLVQIRQHTVAALELLAHLGEDDRELAGHVHVLRALAGEEEGDLAVGGERALRVVHAVERVHPLLRPEHARKGRELRRELRERVGDDRERGGSLPPPRLDGERVGEVGRRRVGTLLQPLREGACRVEDLGARFAAEEVELRRPRVEGRPVVRVELARVLLEHDVEVRAAEAERADAGAARIVADAP